MPGLWAWLAGALVARVGGLLRWMGCCRRNLECGSAAGWREGFDRQLPARERYFVPETDGSSCGRQTSAKGPTSARAYVNGGAWAWDGPREMRLDKVWVKVRDTWFSRTSRS